MTMPMSKKRPVTRPKKPLPAGSVDSHAHVFGPFDRYPLTPVRNYDPPLAPAEHYLEMLDTVGFSAGVLVHAAAKGFDNRSMTDAIALRPGKVIGFGAVAVGTPMEELERLKIAGMRGLRFTDNGRPVPPVGAISLDTLGGFLPAFRRLDWIVNIWANVPRILAHAGTLRDVDLPVVIDHMGFPDPTEGLTGTFRDFLALARDANLWVKLTPIRASKKPHDYSDMRPFHDALLEAIPDRCLYGGDWPYIAIEDPMQDAGHLVDLFDAWTPDEALRRKVFVDNPRRLYEF